jgi:hypothetical protein
MSVSISVSGFGQWGGDFKKQKEVRTSLQIPKTRQSSTKSPFTIPVSNTGSGETPSNSLKISATA